MIAEHHIIFSKSIGDEPEPNTIFSSDNKHFSPRKPVSQRQPFLSFTKILLKEETSAINFSSGNRYISYGCHLTNWEFHCHSMRYYACTRFITQLIA